MRPAPLFSPAAMAAPDAVSSYERLLHEEVSNYYADPLGFVLAMYDWPINGETGPDAWQAEVLDDLGSEIRDRAFPGYGSVEPIRFSISSGHSIGKSALDAWIVDMLMSTRENCRGTVTANTADQLDTKTWAAVREWTARCRTSHWFEINSKIMYRIGRPEWRATWACSPQTSKEENYEAFQGQHARGSTSFYLFDEASAIPDKIWDAAEGGLTDEPIIVVQGNPTRNTGRFHDVCFGKAGHRWKGHVIDARTCKLANHALIRQWAEDYGEDSDFFRVRVRGLAPRSNELQFIDSERVWKAQRNLTFSEAADPLVVGVDVSGGGSAWTVARFRKGLDARSRAPIRLTGDQTTANFRELPITALAEVLGRRGEEKVSAMFIDSAYGAAIVVALRNRGFTNVFEVNFGGPSPDSHQLNMRSFMWNRMKEWLPSAAIPKDDIRLEGDLCAPGFHMNKKNQLVLESKQDMIDRGVRSPDDGDGLALTFASKVQSAPASRPRPYTGAQVFG